MSLVSQEAGGVQSIYLVDIKWYNIHRLVPSHEKGTPMVAPGSFGDLDWVTIALVAAMFLIMVFFYGRKQCLPYVSLVLLAILPQFVPVLLNHHFPEWLLFGLVETVPVVTWTFVIGTAGFLILRVVLGKERVCQAALLGAVMGSISWFPLMAFTWWYLPENLTRYDELAQNVFLGVVFLDLLLWIWIGLTAGRAVWKKAKESQTS